MSLTEIFDRMYEPTSNERIRFRELGLIVPDRLTREWMALGTVPANEDTGTGPIGVEVGAMPARFWRFSVTSCEGNSCVLETGSGDIDTYWPSVLLVAGGMLVPEPSTNHRPDAARVAGGVAPVIRALVEQEVTWLKNLIAFQQEQCHEQPLNRHLIERELVQHRADLDALTTALAEP